MRISALLMVPATGGRGFSRSGSQTPLISLDFTGNRHRLKPRPPVADGPAGGNDDQGPYLYLLSSHYSTGMVLVVDGGAPC